MSTRSHSATLWADVSVLPERRLYYPNMTAAHFPAPDTVQLTAANKRQLDGGVILPHGMRLRESAYHRIQKHFWRAQELWNRWTRCKMLCAWLKCSKFGTIETISALIQYHDNNKHGFFLSRVECAVICFPSRDFQDNKHDSWLTWPKTTIQFVLVDCAFFTQSGLCFKLWTNRLVASYCDFL